MYGHAMSQFSSPFAMQRAKRREQLGHLSQMQNPFVDHTTQGPVNPFLPDPSLAGKEAKEKQHTQKTPWMQQPGLFGVNRQNALMGGLGLLMGGY